MRPKKIHKVIYPRACVFQNRCVAALVATQRKSYNKLKIRNILIKLLKTNFYFRNKRITNINFTNILIDD